MSPTLADLVSYESDPESAPPSPRSRPQPLMTAPRFVANSPGPDYPPLGGGDLHPARLSLFPRIQMISDASDTRDTASTEASSSSARPRCSHSVDSSILGCYSAAHPQSAPTTPVTSIPSIHQPSPRVARVEKMRALRPERKIRLWRTETSTVMSAASSDSSRTSSPMTRKPSCERSASPPALSSSASSECTVTSSQRRTRDADEAPPFINSSPSFHYVPKVQSQGAGTSVHPRFRRYISPQRYTSLDMRDPHADDGGKGARNSREYSSGLARAPEEFSQSRHCDWSSSSSSSSHSCWAPHPDASSSERYHSPLSEPSTSPPRTPPLPVRARYVEATISMSPLGSDGEDELADDDDDDCARSSPASSPSAQPFPAQPLSTEASHASPSPMYARCCWQGCGELFQRNFGPLRKSYAPFNQMHHDVMDHYRTAHGLDFSSARKIPCRWDGCTKEMTGKSFSRHLLDAHMHLEAHRCERCFISFSRRDAVTRHMRKCTGKYAGRMVQPGGRPRVDKLGSPWAQPAAARVDPTNYAPRHLTTIPANVKSRSASEEPLAQVVKRELQNKPLSVHTC